MQIDKHASSTELKTIDYTLYPEKQVESECYGKKGFQFWTQYV